MKFFRFRLRFREPLRARLPRTSRAGIGGPLAKFVVTLIALVAMTAQAVAGPVSVIVLPIGGNADPALRASLSHSVENAAKAGGGNVNSGATTFTETAAAVGCDPAAPACAERVRTTLAVDELVYGTATLRDDGQIDVVIHRKVAGKDPEDVTTTLAPTDPPDRVESAVTPLFGGTAPPPPTCPDNAVPNPDGSCPAAPPPPPTVSNTNRAIAIGATIGAGVFVIGGIGAWQSERNLQGQIDNHPTDTLADFQDLASLEDRASSRAWIGNALIVVGAGLGYVAYRFWKKDRAERQAAREQLMVTPVATPGGAAVVLTYGAVARPVSGGYE